MRIQKVDVKQLDYRPMFHVMVRKGLMKLKEGSLLSHVFYRQKKNFLEIFAHFSKAESAADCPITIRSNSPRPMVLRKMQEIMDLDRLLKL